MLPIHIILNAINYTMLSHTSVSIIILNRNEVMDDSRRYCWSCREFRRDRRRTSSNYQTVFLARLIDWLLFLTKRLRNNWQIVFRKTAWLSDCSFRQTSSAWNEPDNRFEINKTPDLIIFKHKPNTWVIFSHLRLVDSQNLCANVVFW